MIKPFFKTPVALAITAFLCLYQPAQAQNVNSGAEQNGTGPQTAPSTTAGSTAPATNDNPLRTSVVKGLEKSSQLSADLNTLGGLIDQANITFGSLLPTVDLRGATGRERSKVENGTTRSYNANSYGIEARQNLFNGFSSQARYIAAHAHAREAYFRYVDRANAIALESSSAHIDVSRALTLVKLAEDNLRFHRDLMVKLEQKVRTGAEREADLEQAKSRYTLALSNLATEKANAFGAMANYQRITDQVWPTNDQGQYVVQANFEVENTERLVYALNTHPLLRAANSGIDAATAQVTAASEGFYPRVDLRAKSDRYSNYLSTFDDRQISSIDLIATLNLYRGGADEAARSAAIKQRLRTLDNKVTVCKNIRQTTQTALYEVVNLQKRREYFKTQAQTITNAKAAYEQQFLVGRRSLLDLLSAENEFYQAQRALVNIESDLSVAKLKLLATSGQLTSLFDVDELVDASEPTRRAVGFYEQTTNFPTQDTSCPSNLINIEDFNLPNIGFDEAFKSVGNDVIKPMQVAQLGGTRTDASIDPANVSKDLIERTNSWVKAWMSKDANQYLSFYSDQFKPEQGSYESWVGLRKDRVSNARSPEIAISELQVIPSFDDPSMYEITFVQSYRSASYFEKSRKVLTWKSTGGQWKIVRERNLPVTAKIDTKKPANLAMVDTQASPAIPVNRPESTQVQAD